MTVTSCNIVFMGSENPWGLQSIFQVAGNVWNSEQAMSLSLVLYDVS